MADLKVVAVLPAKAGSEDIVRNALATLVAPSRAEAGCVSYDLYESAATPGTFFTVETWTAQSDLDAHMQTAHIAAVIATAGEHLDGPPQILRCGRSTSADSAGRLTQPVGVVR